MFNVFQKILFSSLIFIFAQQSLAAMTMDEAVREAVYNEFADGESCLDSEEDIFDLLVLDNSSELCEMEVMARVHFRSCYSPEEEPVEMETLVCLEADGEGYIGHFVEAWYEE